MDIKYNIIISAIALGYFWPKMDIVLYNSDVEKPKVSVRMQYRQDVMLCNEMQLIAILLVAIGYTRHKVCGQKLLFTFLKIYTAISQILWRYLPTKLQRLQCTAKYI